MIIFQQYPVGKIISVVISTTDSYCIFFKNKQALGNDPAEDELLRHAIFNL